jgi:multidrug efflux system membrane fusion protein
MCRSRNRLFRRRCVLTVTCALVFGLAACDHPTKVAIPLTPVRVAPVEQYTGEEGSRYSASIVPFAQVDLAFKSGGYVATITQRKGSDGRLRDLQPGDFVKKGTVLAVVRQDEYRDQLTHAQAQLDRAQASYEQAKLSFDRAQILFASASITKPDYDSAKANYDAAAASISDAKSGISQAQIALRDCRLETPIDGWIVKRNVEVGSLVGPSVVGFSIVDTRLVKAVFGVPDTAIARVHLGTPRVITTDAVSGEFHGKVTSISPAADPKSRVYSVELTIPNGQDLLKAGMIASLSLGGTKLRQPVASVPLSAIVRASDSGSSFAVFVVHPEGDKTIARLRNVELEQPHGNRMGILSGVSPGDNVISTGATLVRDGEPVQVIP